MHAVQIMQTANVVIKTLSDQRTDISSCVSYFRIIKTASFCSVVVAAAVAKIGTEAAADTSVVARTTTSCQKGKCSSEGGGRGYTGNGRTFGGDGNGSDRQVGAAAVAL